MTDEEMIATLFVSEEGEIRQLPKFEGKEAVTYQYEHPPAKWPIDVADAMKPVEYTTVVWRSVSTLPEPVQKALLRLYRERAAAQLLALDWFHQFYWGTPWPNLAPTGELNNLVDRSRELEREVDKERENR